jgi:spermidine/putrescine transport system substrate-binding protein
MCTEKKNEMLVSRRTVLKVGAAAAGTVAFLAACGTSGSSTSPSPKPSQSDTISDVVNVANWTGYIDLSEDGLTRPTVAAFEAEYSTKVNYQEVIGDNDSFFGTIKAPLQAGEDAGWDVVALTDWMAARIIRLGWAEKLKTSHMSNFTANLLDVYKGRSFDPNVEYLAPWAGIVAGIAANKTTAGFVKEFKDLFDPRLKGKVSLLTEMRDTIGLAMLANGDDPAKADRASFDRAIALIKPSVDNGQVRAFYDNSYMDVIAKGDLAACVAWRGDTVQLGYNDPNIVWVTPTDGCTFSSDNMLIPIGAAHKYTAEKWMDWYYKPEIAAQLTAFVAYVSPVKGTKEEIAKIDATLAADPFIFPNAALEAQLHVFAGLTEEDEIYMTDAYSALMGV